MNGGNTYHEQNDSSWTSRYNYNLHDIYLLIIFTFCLRNYKVTAHTPYKKIFDQKRKVCTDRTLKSYSAADSPSTTYSVSQKNAATLGSCSFVMQVLILIILGKQHQHTFKKMIRIFNFPCPFSSSLLISFAFKLLRRKPRDTSDLKQRIIDKWVRKTMHIIKRHRPSCWSMEKQLRACVISLWTSATIDIKTGSFQSHQQPTEENTFMFRRAI